MKKIALYILTVILLSIVLGTMTAQATSSQISYVPTIPKPSTLPGITREGQITSSEEGTDSSIIKIFVSKALPTFTTGMIAFVGSVSFLFLIISGIRFYTNFGDEEAVGNAKKQATYALIGFAISLFAYTIVTIIVNIDF
ncbi:pilin [Patescibacteria group bacterium]|nr:pilin [Patescibacteria group bacterium]